MRSSHLIYYAPALRSEHVSISLRGIDTHNVTDTQRGVTHGVKSLPRQMNVNDCILMFHFKISVQLYYLLNVLCNEMQLAFKLTLMLSNFLNVC